MVSIQGQGAPGMQGMVYVHPVGGLYCIAQPGALAMARAIWSCLAIRMMQMPGPSHL